MGFGKKHGWEGSMTLIKSWPLYQRQRLLYFTTYRNWNVLLLPSGYRFPIVTNCAVSQK